MPRLSVDDLRSFADRGFVVVHDVIPEELLAAADREIDQMIEADRPDNDGGKPLTGAETFEPGSKDWIRTCSDLPHCEATLHASGAMAAAEELVAPNKLEVALDSMIQVAITIPPWRHRPGGPHVDGHGPEHEHPHSFTMLAGVLMSDQRAPHSGNLWVWPGSHLVHQALFREHGPEVLQQTSGHPTLLDLPVTYERPIQVTGNRGDLVLAHFLLGHNRGGNEATHNRRTLYFRLAANGHKQRWAETFQHIWTEYEPIKALDDTARTARA